MNNDSSGRLAQSLRETVARAAPGSRLPPTRVLVAEHQVSPVTVQKALRRLTAEGLVESRPGVGTFVRARRSVRAAPDHSWQTAALGSPRARLQAGTTLRTTPDGVVGLHGGYPDRTLLPERLVRAAVGRAARGPAALHKPPVAGLPELRSWFADELGRVVAPGAPVATANDTVVLPGSQSGLSSVFRALVGAGQPLVVESPTYWGAISAARQAGARLVPVPSGPDGPDPDEVDRALADSGARAFYAQPSYANPTGAQWSSDRAEAVLEAVRRHGAFLVEDDWAGDFGITTRSRPVAAMDDDGHVVYLRSLTKSVSPALRVGVVVARGPARQRILADRAAEGLYVSGLLQAAAVDVVTQPGWRSHLRGVREQLRERRDLLVVALHRLAPDAVVTQVPAGGLNLWLRLPGGTDVEQVVAACERDGVLVAAGDEWFPAEPSGPFVRVSYAGPEPERFEEGARVLGQVLARLSG